MDIAAYATENFFSCRVDIPSVDIAKQYLEERESPHQGKELTIIIPDRNEDPEALRATVIQLAMSNFLTGIFHQIDNKHFRIKRIIVSDQSDLRIAMNNRGALYTVKDVLFNTLKEADIPEIYHLRFGTEMSKIIYDYLKDPLNLNIKDRGKPILGKGINMALSSLVSSELKDGGVLDHDTVLVFMDAENKAVNYKDPFLLGSPLIYEGSPILFSKAAFKRYHMEGERRKIGGRVNASLGVPLMVLRPPPFFSSSARMKRVRRCFLRKALYRWTSASIWINHWPKGNLRERCLQGCGGCRRILSPRRFRLWENILEIPGNLLQSL
jgi:hypothetical protein